MSFGHQLANAAVAIAFTVALIVTSHLFTASRSAHPVVRLQLAALPL
jgi:hypothetical protein